MADGGRGSHPPARTSRSDEKDARLRYSPGHVSPAEALGGAGTREGDDDHDDGHDDDHDDDHGGHAHGGHAHGGHAHGGHAHGGHAHGSGGGSCADEAAEHETAAADPSGDSLFPVIDVPKVYCLNERASGSGRSVIKPWEERRDRSRFVESSSEDDPELILHVPFTSSVIVRSLCVVGGAGGRSPTRVRLFANRSDVVFSNVEDLKPTQEIHLAEDPSGDVDQPVRPSLFQNIHSLTLHFDENEADGSTQVFYVGFKGVNTKYRRGVVEAVYEILPQASKNKVDAGRPVLM